MPGEPALMHIYGQDVWHAPAWIVGNRAGLEALREAITVALDKPRSEAIVMAGDGEGYAVQVIRDDRSFFDQKPGDWDWAVPYTDEIAQDRPGARYPWNQDAQDADR